MKEEWKVYIKGVQGRGEEVKQALINLGVMLFVFIKSKKLERK